MSLLSGIYDDLYITADSSNILLNKDKDSRRWPMFIDATFSTPCWIMYWKSIELHSSLIGILKMRSNLLFTLDIFCLVIPLCILIAFASTSFWLKTPMRLAYSWSAVLSIRSSHSRFYLAQGTQGEQKFLNVASKHHVFSDPCILSIQPTNSLRQCKVYSRLKQEIQKFHTILFILLLLFITSNLATRHENQYLEKNTKYPTTLEHIITNIN